MSDDWYEVIGPEIALTQGDLIEGCPVLTWGEGTLELNGTREDEVLRDMVDAVRADVVVLTQACDLEHEKVANVILCPHLSLQDFRQDWEQEMKSRGQNPSKNAWEKHLASICGGFTWNLTILNSATTLVPSVDYRIVDFHEVFSVPRAFIEDLLMQRGRDRLRLRPPYREHLSQSFARFFMRVGLPVPVRPPI